MHRDVDRAGAQRRIDLGGEEFLALDLAQRDVGDAIAARVDADELHLEAGVRALQQARHGAALRPRQQRATCAQP